MSTENIKLVGDLGVGKTCLLIAWTNNSFPDDYIPTVFDNYGATTLLFNRHISLGYWDTAGQEEYDRLRPLSYPETNVFLVCFDLSDRKSFDNVQTKWVPEIEEHAPGIPIVLCGTKSDLRETQMCVRTEEGMRMGLKIGAVSYVEVCAKRLQNLRKLFQDCVLSVLIDGWWYDPKTQGLASRKTKGVISSLEDFKKYNFSMTVPSLKKVKKMFQKSQKEVNSLKKHLKKLSNDVVFHIFHHFYLFDFRTSCSYYRSEHSYYQKQLSKSFSSSLNFDQDVFLQCFGYFSRDRNRVFQLFYNFNVCSYPELVLLPKLKKSLLIQHAPNQRYHPPMFLFHDYLNLNVFLKSAATRKVRILELQHVHFPKDFEFCSKMIENDEKQCLRYLDLTITSDYIRREFNTYDFLSILNKKCVKNLSTLKLHRKRPEIEGIRVCRFDRNEFKMLSLKKLVLDQYVMNEDLRFSGCTSLEDITFVGSFDHYPLEVSFGKDQFFDLLKLMGLRKVRFLFYDLKALEGYLHHLFSEYEGPLEEIVLHRCVFDYRYLKLCNFRSLDDLKLVVVTHHLEVEKDDELQNEFPRDFLIRVGEKTKDFQFLLRSSQKGAFSNMKQKYKLKVIREIDGYVERTV